MTDPASSNIDITIATGGVAGPGTGRLLPRNKNASARHRGTAGTGLLLAAGAGGWRRRGSTTLAEEWGQQTCWAAPPPPAKSRMESFPAHLPIQRSQAALTWPDGAQAGISWDVDC